MIDQTLAEVDALLSHLAATSPAVVRGETHANDVLTHYARVDELLVAKGFPPTSPWWREQIHRWYETGCRQFVPRCGRRAGKSSTLSRLAVVEALYGHHDVPPGDTGIVAIISTDRKEASKRLDTVRAILDALGVAYKPWGEGVQGIRLIGQRIGFCVYTASVAGVSGFTSIFVLCDEVAKWKDADTGVNPANEVLKSVRPTMATMPNARIVLSSSPYSVLDAHYDAFEQGNNDFQIVAQAPSWVCNPTLTEASTRELEPDEKAWEREYKAIPSAEVESSLLEEVTVLACTRKRHTGDLPRAAGWTYAAAMDPAQKRHAWTLVIVGQGPKGIRHVVCARQWVPKPKKPLKSEDVLSEIHDILAEYGLKSVHTDQAGTENLRSIIRLLPPEKRTFLVEEPWTPASQATAYDFLKKLAESRRLGLPDDKWIRADLLGVVKKITRSGMSYLLIERDGRHSDYAPSIALAIADARFPHKAPAPPKTEEQREREGKSKMLRDREKEYERAKKFGALPVTHRHRPKRAA